MKVYADNAATTKMSRKSIEAMLPYMEKEYGNPSSLYRLGQQAAEALDEARRRRLHLPRAAASRIIRRFYLPRP